MKSEIRQDLVSGDWIIVATERGNRPHDIKPLQEMSHPEGGDPFEDPEKYGNEVIHTFMNKDESDWWIKVIKNKYPLVTPGVCGPVMDKGPFKYMEGVGFHEVIITRDAERDITLFDEYEMEYLVRVFRDRYREILESDECQKYTLIFHNYGIEAGASLKHPHSQMISIPVFPSDVSRSITGAEKYYKEHGKKAHQVLVEWEMKEGKRTVYENDKFIALCPYASRTPYEIRIYPKDFSPCFEKINDEDLKEFAVALKTVLKKLRDGLDDPAYNFYIHTSPEDSSCEEFYTWHVEILPKVSTMAGFEKGTGVDVSVVDPESAAELLRNS